MRLDDFDYQLPDELIAQYPAARRDGSRLLLLDAESGALAHRQFAEIAGFFKAGDLLVCNNTRVIPARLFARKSSGGRCEILIERVTGVRTALAQIRASKAPKPGSTLILAPDSEGEGDVDTMTVTGRADRFFDITFDTGDAMAMLEAYGHVPLPPYIARSDQAADAERYQTVFAREPGAVAAPTAGLHMTDEILDQLRAQGVGIGEVTLHVGAGTFLPVQVENIDEHVMHSEWLRVSAELVAHIEATRERGGRVIALGTTTVRALESAARTGQLQAFEGESDIFIYPGFKFQVVDAMITNFHLPKSTLLMLVSAFAGRERVLHAYREAVAQQYRFFSYGDAMLIGPGLVET